MDELKDLLARLVGLLKEEDLVDQGMAGLTHQLLFILDPPAMEISKDLMDSLREIPDKMARFRFAAEALGLKDKDALSRLSLTMKQSGLLKNDQNGDVPPETPNEDLMKEHSYLRRLMAIYKECLKGDFHYIDIVKKCAQIIQKMVHEYHEKIEEDFVFSVMKEKGIEVKLVDDLNSQHILVRGFTKKILESDEIKEILQSMENFLAVYTPHGVQEDTVLFPLWRKSLTKEEYENISQQFVKREHESNIDESSLLEQIEQMEKELGIFNLKLESPFDNPIERAKNADLITFPEKINGAICSNCKFVDTQRSYCLEPKVDQPIVVDRQCCKYWDAKGVQREWESKKS